MVAFPPLFIPSYRTADHRRHLALPSRTGFDMAYFEGRPASRLEARFYLLRGSRDLVFFLPNLLLEPAMEEINNACYDALGERWYQAQDDPVALLRAEARHRNPWILEALAR